MSRLRFELWQRQHISQSSLINSIAPKVSQAYTQNMPDAAKIKRCEQCGRTYDKGFRGLLTVLVVVLAFGLAYVQLLRGGSETLIPPWVGVILGSVVSMYYQSKGGERMREITRENAEQSSAPPTKQLKDQ
jgi:hypothetical protein